MNKKRTSQIRRILLAQFSEAPAIGVASLVTTCGNEYGSASGSIPLFYFD